MDAVHDRAPEVSRVRDRLTVWEIFPDDRGALESIDVDVPWRSGEGSALDSPTRSG